MAEVNCLMVVVIISVFGRSGEVRILSGMGFVRKVIISSPVGSILVDGIEGAVGLIGEGGGAWTSANP